MLDKALLKTEERAVFALRSLYRSYGYTPFKMSKFEEYEYYIRNKDFLVSDRIITFNDTSGKLLALKPDVTLSIIKNSTDAPGCKQKLCYDESIYRVSGQTRRFKELLQAGIECIGDIDLYDVFEAVTLAARSLALISEDYILQISHLGVLSAVLDEICTDPGFRKAVTGCIAGKNAHDLQRLCREQGVSDTDTRRLCRFVSVCGPRDQVLRQLEELCPAGAAQPLEQLRQLSRLLDATEGNEKIIFDFSVVNDMNYYNGIVFKGFLSGLSEGILSGGRYDKLMEKMGRRAGAIGFAVYLDLLEQLPGSTRGYDVDVLLLYDETVEAAGVRDAVQRLIGEGKTVSAQRAVPEKLRFRELLRLGKEDSVC